MVRPCILGAERGDQGDERVATDLTRGVSTPENLVASEGDYARQEARGDEFPFLAKEDEWKVSVTLEMR